MIWLQRPPWIRWVLTILIALGALWVEFGSGSTSDYPFAVVPINTGDAITSENTELRPVPSDLLPAVEAKGYATRAYAPDEPLTPSGTSEQTPLPQAESGWWALAIDIPSGARIGDNVQLVLLDSGVVVAGLVDQIADDDPLAEASGAVAIPGEHASEVAAAVANGRVVVLVAAG